MAVRRLRPRRRAGRGDVHSHRHSLLNDVDPQAWLADVLSRIAELPHTRVHELLPWNWKAARDQALAA